MPTTGPLCWHGTSLLSSPTPHQINLRPHLAPASSGILSHSPLNSLPNIHQTQSSSHSLNSPHPFLASVTLFLPYALFSLFNLWQFYAIFVKKEKKNVTGHAKSLSTETSFIKIFFLTTTSPFLSWKRSSVCAFFMTFISFCFVLYFFVFYTFFFFIHCFVFFVFYTFCFVLYIKCISFVPSEQSVPVCSMLP